MNSPVTTLQVHALAAWLPALTANMTEAVIDELVSSWPIHAKAKTMVATPDIVVLSFKPDSRYAGRLADSLRARYPTLEVAVRDASQLELDESDNKSLNIVLFGPAAPSDQEAASLHGRIRTAVASDRLVALASDQTRIPSWKFARRFVDTSDWRDETIGQEVIDELGSYISRYRSELGLEPPYEAIADNSNIVLPDGSIGLNRYLFVTLEEIEFSVRTATALRNDNIVYVGDLVQKSDNEILRIPNMGRKSLGEIKEVLMSMGLSLGLSPVGWPPENIEAELARIAAARRAATLQQKPGGATFVADDDRLAMSVSGDDSDREAAQRPLTQQMHGEIRRKAHLFSGLAQRLDNQIGWSGIRNLGERLETLLDLPTDQIPDVLGYLYPAALELGSFLEMDNALRVGTNSYAAPLDLEVRRPLDDLVRTFAPWLRAFPSVRQMDDEAGQFLVRQADLQPAKAIIQTARAIDLISEDDAATLHALTEAAARGEFQGEKAANRVGQSVRNLVYIGASIVGSFFLGSVSSDYATKSLLVQRAGTLLANAESEILELVTDLPPDLRLSINDLVHESLILPTSPSAPIGAERESAATGPNRRKRRGTRNRLEQ